MIILAILVLKKWQFMFGICEKISAGLLFFMFGICRIYYYPADTEHKKASARIILAVAKKKKNSGIILADAEQALI